MKNILVVGADRGIANAVCLQLQARGERVIAACMGQGEGYGEGGIDTIGGIDVTSGAAVGQLVAALKARQLQLDWLLHVAGVLGIDEFGRIDYDDMRRQFEINTLGPLRVVGVRTVSRRGRQGRHRHQPRRLALRQRLGRHLCLRVSKAGANMVALNLHHDLSKRGVAVVALHPGMVATNLTKDYPGTFNYIQPAEAARGLIARMDELELSSSGRFRHANGDNLPW